MASYYLFGFFFLLNSTIHPLISLIKLLFHALMIGPNIKINTYVLKTNNIVCDKDSKQ